MSRPIITLISDMGLRDHYVASVKGALLSELPEAQIIDVSHTIAPFDIFQAAFVLKNVYGEFPEGTVHVVGVDPERYISPTDPSQNIDHIAVEHNGYFFIMADNGLLSLVFEEKPSFIVSIDKFQGVEHSFPLKSVFIRAAALLGKGEPITALGPEKGKIRQAAIYRPKTDSHTLLGVVLYIDSYGNLITNISREEFERAGKGRDFRIMMRDEDYDITSISERYSDAQRGDSLAIFTTGGLLQISINKGVEGSGGGAARLFGMQVTDSVRIEFMDPPTSIADL